MAKKQKAAPEPGTPLYSVRKGICAAFSPTAPILAVGGGDGVVFFDAMTGKELIRTEKLESAQTSNIGGIAYSQDGSRIVATHMNGILSVCDAMTGKRQLRIKSTPSDHTGLGFMPDTGELAHAGRGPIHFWDGMSGVATRQIAVPLNLREFCISPDGKFLAALSNYIQDSQLDIWNWPKADHKSTFQVISDGWNMAISPDGTTVGVAARIACVLYNSKNGKIIGRCPDAETNPYQTIAFSPDDRFVVTGGRGKLDIWARDDMAKVKSFETGTGEVLEIVFSPDGKLLSVPAYNKTLVWEFASLI